MTAISNFHLKDQREKPNFLAEVAKADKQLWALINTKGLLNSEVQDIYRKVRSSYENIILGDYEQPELQDVEYSMWKLHYKHIDEFRKRIKKNSAETTKLRLQHELNHIEGFKLFLSEATQFYESLILKIRKCYKLPEDSLFFRKGSVSTPIEFKKMQKCQFLCHRVLVCLGDLARYREQCEKSDALKHNWSVAASHYVEATLIWPDSGNPQNQLAVLATYVGDEFLTLYHCIRSLAVKEPFPDAQDNLILLLETNRSSDIRSLTRDIHFNFFKPSERCTKAKSQSSDNFSYGNMLKAKDGGFFETNFWSLFVRVISFFFIKSSLDEFPDVFASSVRELDALMALDDVKLRASLESYQRIESVRAGPFRALQVISILLFTLQNLIGSPKIIDLKDVNDTEQIVLLQLALTATFIYMGRFVERCLKSSTLTSNPLLPAVLVFVEWLERALDKAETYAVDEKSRCAMSYFLGVFVDILKRFKVSNNEHIFPDGTPLWEDYELKGFTPVACSHASFDFSSHCENVDNFESGTECRAYRILSTGLKIVSRSNDSQKWVMCSQSSGDIQHSYVLKSSEFSDRKVAKKLESNSSRLKTELANQRVFGDAKEHEKNILGEDLNVTGKSVTTEEEEVILFKPLTRYNSEPLYTNSNGPTSPKEVEDLSVPSDECLRRATSLLIAQNQAKGDPPTLHADITNFRHNKSFKRQESVMKDAGQQPVSDMQITAGPPSLSAWVLDTGSLNNDKEKAASGIVKHGLSPIEEIQSETLNGLSISESEYPMSHDAASTTHSSSSHYSPPLPSAPLLPDDAVWFDALQSSFTSSKFSEGISTESFSDPSQVRSYLNWTAMQRQPDYGLRIPVYPNAYPPPGHLTSSEWLRHYRENHNLNSVYNDTCPSPFYAPVNTGNFYNNDASRYDLFDEWGNPLVSNLITHAERPALRPGFPLDYCPDGHQREKLFHGYQQPSPFGCGALTEIRNEKQSLLQYLKEKERQIQLDPNFRGGPAYMGN